MREYFGTLIPPTDHKFAALHYAVWSGGSFVYVPAGVTLPYPLQSYFRLNAAGAGQFEHTLIIVEPGADLHFIEGCSAPKYYEANLHAGAVELFVKDGARLRYSTIENWSKNMYNLNTKRATVERGRRDRSGSPVQLRQPRELPLPHHHPRRRPWQLRVHRHHVRRRRARTSTPAARSMHERRRHDGVRRHQVDLTRTAACSTFRSLGGRRPAGRPRDAATVSCQSLMLDDIAAASDTIPAMDVRSASAERRATRRRSAASPTTRSSTS